MDRGIRLLALIIRKKKSERGLAKSKRTPELRPLSFLLENTSTRVFLKRIRKKKWKDEEDTLTCKF